MKTTYIKSAPYSILLLFVLSFFCFISCDDDEGTGTPVIEAVRRTDPATADSTFTESSRGTMIVILGKNFGGLLKIYINEQEVGFNANYSTSTSIIVSIPDELELTATNGDLKGGIRIVTTHGEAFYDFHILAPAPAITRLAINYPATPGDQMSIVGENFYEIQRIYFTDTDPESLASGNITEVQEYGVTDYQIITLTIPNNIPDEGYLVVECYTSNAVSQFFRDVPVPMVYSISSDMPVMGAEVYITGRDFISISSLNINGQYNIPASSLYISEANDSIIFTLPLEPTTSGKIIINALGGMVEVPGTFYPLENVILDYDNVGSFSWGADDMRVIADGSAPPYVSTGICYGFNTYPGAWNFWFATLVNNGEFPSTAIIPGDTPLSNMEIRFECYVEDDIDGIYHEVVIADDWDNYQTNYTVADIHTGKVELGKWFTSSMPIVVSNATTYQDLLNKNNEGIGIYSKNATDNGDVHVEMYFDNFRILIKE